MIKLIRIIVKCVMKDMKTQILIAKNAPICVIFVWMDYAQIVK
jgi:hypothetical protein